MRAFEILNEMIIRARAQGGETVIAHRDSIWIVNPYHPGSEEQEAALVSDISARTGLEGESLNDLIENTRSMRPDVLVGHIYGGVLELDSVGSMRANPESSLLIKKVVKQLGLGGVIRNHLNDEGDDEDNKEEVTANAILGRIPNVVYHGTNTNYIYDILKVGLAPNDNRNWSEVGKFRDKIFLTANFSEAMFHANRQASHQKSSPVVVATRIPDRNRIVADFDIVDQLYGHGDLADSQGYTGSANFGTSHSQKVQKYSPKTNFTREVGTFAYRGRIPSINFTGVYLATGEKGTMMTDQNKSPIFKRADVMNALEMLSEYDFYDPDFDPSASEDDWDEQDTY